MRDSHINKVNGAEPSIFEYLIREICIFMSKKGWSLPNFEYLMRGFRILMSKSGRSLTFSNI